MALPNRAQEHYQPLTARTLSRSPFWDRIPSDQREVIEVVSRVLPFRVNGYVARELIDWERVPDDPIYQLTFPQREMLAPEDYQAVRRLIGRGASRTEIQQQANAVRLRLNPHPAGQRTDNVPRLGGRALAGLQHKYNETVLFFPAPGQTCHAYCTYCFRWAQFVDLPEMRFSARQSSDLVAYLKAHPEVTDVLITGGDPLIMKTATLRRYVEPLLSPHLRHLRHIRIGSKALGYWPHRFVTDPDADDLLRLFEEVGDAGRHLALMAHVSHPRELKTPMARRAIQRVRGAGATLRMQAPLVRRVNDRASAWAAMWRLGVRLGMVPYYMFVERDTGPRRYFEVPLARALEVFREAYGQLSGLARTVRGPSMSAWPGKVRVLGTARIGGDDVFVLDLLQGRRPEWIRRPFFARFDPTATWLDDLRPAFGEDRFFFEEGDDACGDEDPREAALVGGME